MTEQVFEQIDFDRDIAQFTPRQLDAIAELDSGEVKYLLYGGALGGGKSYFLRWWALRRLLEFAERGMTHVSGMICCEDYPALKDRQLQKISREFPPWLGRMHMDHREYGRAYILRPEYGSGVICFRNLDDPSKYASAEFAFILVDELTKNDYDTFTFLRTRMRWPGLDDSETTFIGATNPGGIGHGWCKQLWMDKDFPREFMHPVDYRQSFSYVPSRADDNPHLDPSYWAMLGTLPEQIRKAFRDGDWNLFVGQAFTFSKQRHVCPANTPIPKNAHIYMTFDWGYGAPFSIGWWWIDADNRAWRFDEWYGWSGQPNQGLRITDHEVAKGIIEREEKMGIAGKDITRVAGPDCFQKRPNYMGGGQGPSTAEVFATHDLYLTVGDANRDIKIRAFRERLFLPEDKQEKPMMMIYEHCGQFLRTIPNLVVDSRNIEDIDTNGEDHIYDEACHICMARPMSLEKATSRSTKTEAQQDWDIITGKGASNQIAVVDDYGL